MIDEEEVEGSTAVEEEVVCRSTLRAVLTCRCESCSVPVRAMTRGVQASEAAAGAAAEGEEEEERGLCGW